MEKRQRLIRIILLALIGVTSLFAASKPMLRLWATWSGSDGDDTIAVVIADVYIPPFQIIRPDAVTVRRYPRGFEPVGALQTADELYREDGQPLYQSVVGIPKGQPLSRMVLNEAGRENGMSSLLRPGKVAVSFPIERSRAAGGWIRPGDTIAIFEALAPDGSVKEGGKQTRLLLESVQVLALDQEHVGQKSNPAEAPPAEEGSLFSGNQPPAETQTVTVLTGMRDASLLVEAREHGPLNVVLRPMGDDLPWLAK